MLSQNFAARAPTTINVLPQELKHEIADLVYAGMPTKTVHGTAFALANIQDLSTNLNFMWAKAFEQPLEAAAHALQIHRISSGKKLADTLHKTSSIDPTLRGPSLQAADARLNAARPRAVANTAAAFLDRLPSTAPAGIDQPAWDQKRDTEIARFAASALSRAPDILEDFLKVVMASRAPMDKLVGVLLDFIEGQRGNMKMVESLDEYAPRMPACCRPSFVAVRACMVRGAGREMRFDEILDLVLDAPPSLRWKLLVKMDRWVRTEIDGPPGHVCAGKQRLIDAIAKLPLRYRRLALENVQATDWEDQRSELVSRSLPEDVHQMTAHLAAYFGTFDTANKLDDVAAHNTLTPLSNTLLNHACPATVPAAIRLLALRTGRSAEDSAIRSQVLNVFTSYQLKLPPRERLLMGMLIGGLLLPEGEPKLRAFHQNLQGLKDLSAKAISDVLCALCKPDHGLPPYIFMSSLCALRIMMEKIPLDQRGPANEAVFRLTERFGADDKAVARRSLGFAPGTMYFR